jgi:hypothetical protein
MRRLAPIALLFVACASSPYVRQESDTLYFGTSKPSGGVVSAAEWHQFLREVVTPRFPGFTHWDAHGEWKNVREETHVLVIFHEEGHEAAVREIIEEYKRRFAQEEVLRVKAQVLLPRK